MCDMNTYFPNNATGYVPGPTHEHPFNGDAHHHGISGCHENGRGPPHHPQYSMQYPDGPQLGPQAYPRFPPFNRLEPVRGLEGTNPHHVDPSPYYNCGGTTAPPSTAPQQHTPQQPAQVMTQQQYEPCSRGTLTPPHDQQQYPSCKLQPGIHHNDSMGTGPPSLVGGSPPPQHPQSTHMYQGPVPSPSQNSNVQSPLYPWMRSQFGESCFRCYIIVINNL